MFSFELYKSKSVIGKASIIINRPVLLVYEFVALKFFENYPKWALEVVNFMPINGNPMAVGALARQTRFEQGQHVESTFEVAKLENNQLLELMGLSEPYRHRYLFESPIEEKTLLTFIFELLELDFWFCRKFSKVRKTTIFQTNLSCQCHKLQVRRKAFLRQLSFLDHVRSFDSG